MKNVVLGFFFLLATVISFHQVSTVEALEVLEIRGESAIPAAKMSGIEKKEWTLQYKLKDNNLYVECIVPDFSLLDKEKGGDGYLLVRMNDQETVKMNQAAFIIKNLPPGKHSFEVSPLSYDGKSKKESIEFEVEVSESS